MKRPRRGAEILLEGDGAIIRNMACMDEALKNVLSMSFRSAPSAMMVVRARDRRVMVINEAFTALFGYEPEQIVGQDVEQISFWISPLSRRRMMQSLFNEDRAHRADHPFNTQDGRTLIISLSSRLMEQDGEQYVFSVLNDVTEVRLAERRVMGNEMTLRVMLDASLGGAALLSRYGDIIACNQRICNAYGKSYVEMLGRNFTRFLSLGEATVVRDWMEQVASERRTMTFEHEFSGMWLRLQIAPILLNVDGACIMDLPQGAGVDSASEAELRCLRSCQDVTAFAVSVVNLTEVRRIEREREQLIIDLQKALAEVKTLRGMLPVCSHCKKIRNDEGSWETMEQYVSEHSEASFSHGVCPDCMQKYYASELAAMRARQISKRAQ